MSNTIDAKGLSCPQPVILTLKEIAKTNEDEVIVLVDTNTSKENVVRAGQSKGWKSDDIEKVDGGYKIILRRDK